MHRDDQPVGKLLSRREGMKLLLASGGALMGLGAIPLKPWNGNAAPPCVVKPELTEGPFFADLQLHRSDIRLEPTAGEFMPGAVLALNFSVVQFEGGTCSPLPGAMVNIWHCDAKGKYAAFNDSRDMSFLRGYQVTDEQGMAHFTTIYPGWYPGRAVHIHFKIRKSINAGKTYEFTSQLFFDETLTDTVHAQTPYAPMGKRDTLNTQEGIYRRSEDQLLLDVVPQSKGYATNFALALDFSDVQTGRTDGWRRNRR